MSCVFLNHAQSLPCEQIALSVYITTSRSHRWSVMYLVCFMRTTWLTSDANDFVNAKSHARQKLCSHGTPSLPQWYNRSSPRFLHVFKKITQQNLSTPPEAKIDYKGYPFHCFHTSGKLKVVVLQPTVVSRFGCFVFESWVLRFRVLGASFSSLECFVFEIWVLRASVFVFECFVFETTAFDSIGTRTPAHGLAST